MEPDNNGHSIGWVEKMPVPININMDIRQDRETGKKFLVLTFNTPDVTATFFVPDDYVVEFAKAVERKASETVSNIVLPGLGIIAPE